MKLTAVQEKELRELAFAKMANKEIAARMGLPMTEVYAHRSRMGITLDKVALAKGEAPRTNIVTQQSSKHTVRSEFEAVHPKTKKAPEVEAQGLTEKDLYCAMKHLKAFFEQSCNEEAADWGKPCIDCPQHQNCGFTQIDNALYRLSELTGIIISRHRPKP